MSDRLRWRADSAWADIANPGTSRGDGVVIEFLDRMPLATIVARPGREALLSSQLQERLGCAPPASGGATIGVDGTLVWSAPNQWLAVGFDGPKVAALPAALEGIAAVTDQTDSRALLDISGPASRTMLAKGFAIDLHPSVFASGSAAVTKVAHLSVQIWQTDETQRYRISVPRSSAGTFWSWLMSAVGTLHA